MNEPLMIYDIDTIAKIVEQNVILKKAVEERDLLIGQQTDKIEELERLNRHAARALRNQFDIKKDFVGDA